MVRFDKPCSLIAGAVEYFRKHMQVGDYLSQAGEAEMTWVGAGARRLGLTGVCQLEDFERLCRGLHPATRARLFQRDKGARRRVGYFGQISPPKDVSLLYLVGGDRRIAAWWDDAVRETLAEIEGATATRVRRAGATEDRYTGELVAAVVTHDASRALDPQLHTHVCVLNVTYDPVEQRWKGVQPADYFRRQGYFREVCYNRLAARLLAAGYELESVRGIGFNIKGVPSTLRDRFSKRRRAILEQAAGQGATDQDALQAVAGRTRQAKTVVTSELLQARWRREAADGLTVVQELIAATSSVRPAPPRLSPTTVLESAEAHVFERSSVYDAHGLLREALRAGRGRVELADLKQAMADRTAAGELICSGREIASRDGLAAEEEFTAWAGRLPSKARRWGQTPELDGLGPDQAKAVQGILAATAPVLILQGDAGTGKTTSLQAIVAGINAAGGQVFGCAPSAGAAAVLRQEVTPEADTLQQLLVNPRLQAATRHRVLLVDEAGLMSVRDMRDLCRLAAANANRVLLVGDTKQHGGVEAGDALRCLHQYARVPVFRLTEIRRQADPAYRRAVSLLARGEAFSAFNQFARLGAVKEIPEPPDLFRAAAEDYVRTLQTGRSVLAISPVWSEIHRFTGEVRLQLRAAGCLPGPDRMMTTLSPLQWTREERRRAENYEPGDQLVFYRDSPVFRKHETLAVIRREGSQLVVRSSTDEVLALDPRQVGGFTVGLPRPIPIAPGDRLLIRANLKESGLRNGDLVTVGSFAEDGGIRLTDGRQLPAWFREFSHGYATTSHAAQGRSVDRGILLMADEGILTGNLKQAYVSNSRFRESQAIYTSDRRLAREAMMRPADRKLALEMIRPAPVSPTLVRGWPVRPSVKAATSAAS